jgi:hypothetical protein
MASNVIEGFLVSLGFKVDADAQARFNKSIEDAGKRMRGVAVKAGAAAAAIGAAWINSTKNVSKDFNIAKFSGSSIRGLTALRTAFKNAGGDAGMVDSALLQITARFRTMPGYADAFERTLGVPLKDANGNLRDTSEVLAEVSEKMQGMSDAQAAQISDYLGLGDAWQILKDKDFPRYLEDARKQTELMGQSLDESAKSSNELWVSITNLTNAIGLGLKSAIGELNKEFDFSGKINELTKKVPEATKKATTYAKAVISSEMRLWNESDGFWGWFKNWIDPETTDRIYREELEKYEKQEKEKAKKLSENAASTAATVDNYKEATIGPLPSGKTPLGIRNNNPGNIREVGGGGFRKYATLEDGVYALARQLKMYQNAGAKTVADMVTNWAPAGDSNDTYGYASSVSKYLSKRFGTQVTAGTALNLSDPRVLAAMTEAITRRENGLGWERAVMGDQFKDEFVRAAQVQAKSRAWSAKRNTLANNNSTTINQTINVSDRDAAKAIAKETRLEIERAAVTRALARGVS